VKVVQDEYAEWKENLPEDLFWADVADPPQWMSRHLTESLQIE
jgi:hypothetical protein